MSPLYMGTNLLHADCEKKHTLKERKLIWQITEGSIIYEDVYR